MPSVADSIIPIALCLYILRCGFTGFFIASRHRVTVSHLYDFIRCIADGHCNDNEARLWSMWSSHYQITIHHINHDSRRGHTSRHLLLHIYNTRLYWLFALYALLVLTSHWWVSFATTIPLVCDPTCNMTTSLCRIGPEQLHRPLNTHIEYGKKMSMDDTPPPAIYRFYRDSESGKYYVALRMIDDTYEWFHPPDLVRQLSKISGTNHTCICPVLMGIAENITFIESERREWLVMYQPFVYRNNTMSNKIESSLLYRKESPFYENYRQFVSKMGFPQSLIHYETMYIEYTEIWPQRIIDQEAEASVTNRPPLILSHEDPVTKQRRITLTQSDTICFYFCDTMNSVMGIRA